jgi:hypothetical protein
LRAKEFLSARGVEYDSIDVTKTPERLDAAVARFGIKALPLGTKGARAVNAQNLSDLASLIGETLDDTPVLSPEELVKRTDAFMQACQRYARQFPKQRLHEMLPYRDWDYLKLVHHVFFISHVFVNQMKGEGEGPAAAFEMPVPGELKSFEDAARYGEAMRAELAAWWSAPGRIDFQTIFASRAGDRTAHQVLERACWHIGQHVRQVEHMVKENGLAPDGPLTPAMLDKLPLPKNVWSDL